MLEILERIKNLGGTPIEAKADNAGRKLTNPYLLRGILTTASATPTRGAETTLFSGDASNLLDVVLVSAVNSSGNAVQMSLRSGTGGTVLDSFYVPGTGSVHKQYHTPFPQTELGQAWTIQNANSGELSDSPVTVYALAVKNPNPGT